MTKDLQLGIPKPCSENWNQMTPDADGRFCSSCQKTVLDFSTMEDKEILQWFANHQGSTCGRFRPDQLNRPMVNPPEKKTPWRYWHYLVAGLLFSSEVSAQTKPAAPPISQQDNRILLGEIKTIPAPKPSIDSIRGRVVDTNGNPVAGATIICSKTHTTLSNPQGYFSIPDHKVPTQGIVSILSIGYKPIEINVDELRKANQIQLTPEISMIQAIAGGISITHTRRKPNPIADTISIFKDTLASIGLLKNPLTIYPNPVAKGYPITVCARLDQTGTYTIQLFSISGTLMQTTQVNGAPKIPTFSINIPPALNPGTYIVRVSHPALTRSYTQQIVVF